MHCPINISYTYVFRDHHWDIPEVEFILPDYEIWPVIIFMYARVYVRTYASMYVCMYVRVLGLSTYILRYMYLL